MLIGDIHCTFIGILCTNHHLNRKAAAFSPHVHGKRRCLSVRVLKKFLSAVSAGHFIPA